MTTTTQKVCGSQITRGGRVGHPAIYTYMWAVPRFFFNFSTRETDHDPDHLQYILYLLLGYGVQDLIYLICIVQILPAKSVCAQEPSRADPHGKRGLDRMNQVSHFCPKISRS